MEENKIVIGEDAKEIRLLPMGGEDSQGNLWQVDNVSFLKNGKRFLPVMGEFHFSRYEAEDWEEELLKMKAGGIDIAATYVFWIHHEERKGEWDFSGCRNLRGFLETCRRINMPVWLRIGPWAHGECRNGGFPDWVVSDPNMQVRTEEPAYLKLVETFYKKLGEQASGMMCKDGGPVIGIQLENEYGHCGGPSDRKEGMAHMRTLKRLAKEAGFDVPYYTATGWGGAYVVDGEMLPVLGGYVDAPWAEHVEQMPASANFTFSSYKQDENIGSDLKRENNTEFTFDPSISPYLTAELGGGLQVTSHRRTWPSPEDVEAQSICMLGGGANLLGYYMYHGGINPDGKYSTLQESRATGYSNDLPVKSYDFQTCIRESGEINRSFGKLKKIHFLLEDFGETLAGSRVFFAENQPESPEDLHTLRVSARVNFQNGAGFLFINNHVRHRRMDSHHDASVLLQCPDGQRKISRLNLEAGDCGVIPFNFPLGKAVLEATNAFLLCRLGERIFFYTNKGKSGNSLLQDLGEKVYFTWKEGKAGSVIVLSENEADRVFRIDNCLYITEREDDCLVNEGGKLYLLTKAEREIVEVYKEKGEPIHIVVEAADGRPEISVRFELEKEEKVVAAGGAEGEDTEKRIKYRDYHIDIEYQKRVGFHQLYLGVDYVGDRAEVYMDGKLVDDWFTNGEQWHIALRRFGFPEKLTIRVYSTEEPLPNPYGNRVYYDLPVKRGCGVTEVRVLPEYKILIEEP